VRRSCRCFSGWSLPTVSCMGGSDAPQPSRFVLQCLSDLRPVIGAQPSVLDVAMGAGRHGVALARCGFRVFGVDRDYARVREARRRLRDSGSSSHLWVADLESRPLPQGHFDLVLCTRYLHRALWSHLSRAVAPGGFLLYETFTVEQRRYDWGPQSSEHLLTPGELRAAFADWDVWVYEERDAPAAEASLLARRPAPRLI